MKVKRQKLVTTAFDYENCTDLPTDSIRYNGEALVCLPAHENFPYLGVRASLPGRSEAAGAGAKGAAEGAAESGGAMHNILRSYESNSSALSA